MCEHRPVRFYARFVSPNCPLKDLQKMEKKLEEDVKDKRVNALRSGDCKMECLHE